MYKPSILSKTYFVVYIVNLVFSFFLMLLAIFCDQDKWLLGPNTITIGLRSMSLAIIGGIIGIGIPIIVYSFKPRSPRFFGILSITGNTIFLLITIFFLGTILLSLKSTPTYQTSEQEINAARIKEAEIEANVSRIKDEIVLPFFLYYGQKKDFSFEDKLKYKNLLYLLSEKYDCPLKEIVQMTLDALNKLKNARPNSQGSGDNAITLLQYMIDFTAPFNSKAPITSYFRLIEAYTAIRLRMGWSPQYVRDEMTSSFWQLKESVAPLFYTPSEMIDKFAYKVLIKFGGTIRF